jgi:hypothetical protein
MICGEWAEALCRRHESRAEHAVGGVLGYACFMGYSTANRNGIVMLANGVTDDMLVLGTHLLNADFPPPQ